MNNFLSMLAAVLAILMTSIVPACGQTAELLRQLGNAKTTNVAREQLLVKSRYDQNVRTELAQTLPTLLIETSDPVVVRSEAKLAGALKLTNAIPALAKLLSFRNYDLDSTMASSTQLADDPVAQALYEMGPSAYPALAQTLESGDRTTRARAANVLIRADTSKARNILNEHLAREGDSLLRHSIEARLK